VIRGKRPVSCLIPCSAVIKGTRPDETIDCEHLSATQHRLLASCSQSLRDPQWATFLSRRKSSIADGRTRTAGVPQAAGSASFGHLIIGASLPYSVLRLQRYCTDISSFLCSQKVMHLLLFQIWQLTLFSNWQHLTEIVVASIPQLCWNQLWSAGTTTQCWQPKKHAMMSPNI
jgi:hypothetical protein